MVFLVAGFSGMYHNRNFIGDLAAEIICKTPP